jgi:hypothetical protein
VVIERELLGDAPIQKEYYDKMNEIARRLDVVFNGDLHGKDRPTGFVLLVFPFSEFEKGDTRCNYISNGADRNDVVTLMKEMITRFEGQPEMKGRA